MLSVKQTPDGWAFNHLTSVLDEILWWRDCGIAICPQCAHKPAFYDAGDPCPTCGYPGGYAVPFPMTLGQSAALEDRAWWDRMLRWDLIARQPDVTKDDYRRFIEREIPGFLVP